MNDGIIIIITALKIIVVLLLLIIDLASIHFVLYKFFKIKYFLIISMIFTRQSKRIVGLLINCIRNNIENTSSIAMASTAGVAGVTLQKVITQLEELAPLKYAENWDNVGLLIEPFTPRLVQIIFLTNDLTEDVLKEAIDAKADMIISYHPPIFAPLKRIAQSNWKERIVSICLENRIAVYSPHTSWDFVRNGVNDWLASALPHLNSEPIEKLPDSDDGSGGGIGRFLTLDPGLTLGKAIDAIKLKARINDVRLSVGKNFNLNSEIKTAAICAGSGARVLRNVRADIYVTGEMSHHEVLNAQQNNICVILCNHSNSERGYLHVFKSMLRQNLNNVNIVISKIDADPLVTV